MRVLVVADDEARRDGRRAALERVGATVVGACDVARVASEVRAARPDVVVVDGPASAAGAREVLRRARGAAEGALAAVLLMAEGATWLRTPLPRDVQPAVVLPSSGLEDRALLRALESLRAGGAARSEALEAHGLRLDLRSFEVRRGARQAVLTASEGRVLEALLARPSTVVRVTEIARALYGNDLGDPHTRAAIRGHVSTLRAKLASIGGDGQVEALHGVGYRVVEAPRSVRRPRG